MTSFQGYSSSGQSGNRWQPLPIIASRDPIDQFDLADPSGGPYQIDQEWFNTSNQGFWKYAGQGNWVKLATGSGSVVDFIVPLGTSPVFPTNTGDVTLTSSGGTIDITGSTNTINFDANGSKVIQKITGDDTVAVLPVAGNINLLGLVVPNATHAKAVFTESPIAGTEKIDVQVAAAIAATDVTKVGLAAFSNAQFNVDANGFTTLKGGTGPALLTMSDDVNTLINPSASGNIQLVGHVVEQGATKFSTVVSGTNLANINPMSSSRWIVDPLGFNGTHTTLTSALASSTSGDTIFILAGSVLTENVTLKAGVNICAYGCDAFTPNVTILGKATLTTAGTVSIFGVQLKTNTDFFLAVTGSAASIVNLIDCYLNCLDAHGILYSSSSSSSAINITNCNGDIGVAGGALYDKTSPGLMLIRGGRYTNSGATVSTTDNSIGNVGMSFCEFNFPFSTSSTGSIAFNQCVIDTSPTNTACVTTAGTGSGNSFKYSRFTSGTASSISVGAGTTVTATLCDIASTNTNAITGAGTLVYDTLAFTNTSSTINTTTQTVRTVGPRIAMGGGGCQIISGAGSPSGSITAPKGSLWLRTDGSGVNDRAYINTDAGTTWTAIVTVA